MQDRPMTKKQIEEDKKKLKKLIAEALKKYRKKRIKRKTKTILVNLGWYFYTQKECEKWQKK